MTTGLTQKLDVYQPLDRARRCLDAWLKEERRFLPRPLRLRTAALLARYFQHEEQVTDQLILSFLRHYSGLKEIDMEDPASVRMEIKSLLDKSVAHVPHASGTVMCALLAGILAALLLIFGWHLAHKKITPDQALVLKSHVARAALRDSVSQAAVWSRIKKPLGVSRYQDISYWDYARAVEMVGQSRPGM